jgi:hypothetical protein
VAARLIAPALLSLNGHFQPVATGSYRDAEFQVVA